MRVGSGNEFEKKNGVAQYNASQVYVKNLRDHTSHVLAKTFL